MRFIVILLLFVVNGDDLLSPHHVLFVCIKATVTIVIVDSKCPRVTAGAVFNFVMSERDAMIMEKIDKYFGTQVKAVIIKYSLLLI